MAVVTCTRRGERADARIAKGARVEPCHGDLKGEHFSADEDIHLIEYEGAVLGTWERNGYDDSDFYALVWDGEQVTSVQYATTRGWTYHNGASVDATDEVKDLAAAYLAADGIKRYRQADLADAADVAVGKRVRVVKGRKIAKGTEGTIGWLGEDRYSGSRYGTWGPTKRRIRLDTDDGERTFTAAGNVEVIDPGRYLTSEADLAAKLADWTEYTRRNDNYVGAYRSVEAELLRGRGYHDRPEYTGEQWAELEAERAAEARLGIAD